MYAGAEPFSDGLQVIKSNLKSILSLTGANAISLKQEQYVIMLLNTRAKIKWFSPLLKKRHFQIPIWSLKSVLILQSAFEHLVMELYALQIYNLSHLWEEHYNHFTLPQEWLWCKSSWGRARRVNNSIPTMIQVLVTQVRQVFGICFHMTPVVDDISLVFWKLAQKITQIFWSAC